MVTFFNTVDGKIKQIEELSNGCWVNVVNPDEDEIKYLIDTLKVDSGFVKAALDEEEASRVDSEDDQTLIIVDVPSKEKSGNAVIYFTLPIGIILTSNYIITVCLRETSVLRDFSDGQVKNVQTSMKTRFVLFILLRVAICFLQYLKQIDKLSSYIEKQLHKSMKNKELIQLLDLEKSLVYFSTSLKSDETTLEKILRGRVIKLYEDDQELLEDVLIEIKQAIEMSNIYSSILTGTMDAFASIISNNLNMVMKTLTSFTIILAIPTMIASFYGMNVGLPMANFWFPVAIAAILTLIAGFLLIKRKMF